MVLVGGDFIQVRNVLLQNFLNQSFKLELLFQLFHNFLLLFLVFLVIYKNKLDVICA